VKVQVSKSWLISFFLRACCYIQFVSLGSSSSFSWDLAAQIQQLSPCISILFLSSYTHNELASEAPGAPLDFVAKPFSSGTLLRKVREVLDR
jgi:two-component SAPR family response regulator